MATTVTTVYAFDMPKFVYVQLFAHPGVPTPPPIRIRGDKFEKGGGTVMALVKLGNDVVGEFSPTSIQGWWIQDEENPA